MESMVLFRNPGPVIPSKNYVKIVIKTWLK
jgi:hypothetical protein